MRFSTAKASGICWWSLIHDTGWLVWAGKNHTKETLARFFDDFGTEHENLPTETSEESWMSSGSR